jgi:hypothetical protein
MPGKCPACQTQIRHEGPLPEVECIYRCHVCRLELVRDVNTGGLIVAPRPQENAKAPGP